MAIHLWGTENEKGARRYHDPPIERPCGFGLQPGYLAQCFGRAQRQKDPRMMRGAVGRTRPRRLAAEAAIARLAVEPLADAEFGMIAAGRHADIMNNMF
jgi:hypothetical protein